MAGLSYGFYGRTPQALKVAASSRPGKRTKIQTGRGSEVVAKIRPGDLLR